LNLLGKIEFFFKSETNLIQEIVRNEMVEKDLKKLDDISKKYEFIT